MATQVRKRNKAYSFDSGIESEAKRAPISHQVSIRLMLLYAFSACLLISLLVLVFSRSPIQPLVHKYDTPPLLQGTLAPNDRLLKQTEKIFDQEIIGPESLVIDGEYLYTGTLNLGVVRIHLTTSEVARLPPLGSIDDCGSYEAEDVCGRPMGMRIFNGHLYVIDAYLGLHKYDLNDLTKAPKKLLGNINFGNDIAIASNGLIYLSDSSKKWQHRDFLMLLLETSTDGALLEFNETSGELRVLSDTLSFANGVELSPDEDFVLVAELARARIARYWLKGQKKGQWDLFNENLPGLPDNIRKSKNQTFWIGLAAVRLTNRDIMGLFAPYPFLRSIAAKVAKVWPALIVSMLPKYGLLIEADLTGDIIQSFHDPSGAINSISEVVETQDGSAYLGSFNLPFLTKFYLK